MKEQNKPITLSEISESSKKRVALITKEFTDGFEFIKNYPRSVTFFGSARMKENEPYYKKARALAGRIVKELHYSVVTGGGPGIMEAANRGAFENSGNSLGLTIDLPHEQIDNKYMTDKEDFHYFFSRKVCLSFSAEAYVYFPGGFGTLDEFLEVLTLIQTNKIPKAPIILVGSQFWNPIEQLFRDILMVNKTIGEEDLSLYTITDNEDEIIKIIKEAPIRLGIKYNENSEKPNKNKKTNDQNPLSSLFKKINW